MLVFYFLAVLVNVVFADISKDCYDCASVELKDKWYLTMLPVFPNLNFTAKCSGEKAPKVSCNSQCVTFLIENPDPVNPNGESYNDKVLFVRGCLSKLTQIPQSSNNQDYCEEDTSLKQSDAQGNLVDAKYKILVCSNIDPNGKLCNSDTGFDVTQTCTPRPDSNTNNVIPKCYECDKKNGDCQTGSCSKRYCVKKTTRFGKEYSTQKYCSDVNPFGISEVCGSTDLKQYPFGVHTDICVCKDKQFCNGAPSTVITSVFALIIAAKLIG